MGPFILHKFLILTNRSIVLLAYLIWSGNQLAYCFTQHLFHLVLVLKLEISASPSLLLWSASPFLKKQTHTQRVEQSREEVIFYLRQILTETHRELVYTVKFTRFHFCVFIRMHWERWVLAWNLQIYRSAEQTDRQERSRNKGSWPSGSSAVCLEDINSLIVPLTWPLSELHTGHVRIKKEQREPALPFKSLGSSENRLERKKKTNKWIKLSHSRTETHCQQTLVLCLKGTVCWLIHVYTF